MKEGVQQFGRLLTAMVTPFDESGELSVERTRRLASHLADTGTETIVVSGTTGESPALTEHERMTLLITVLNEVGHRCKVVAGTSTYSTQESIDLSRLASDEGAHGLLLVTPYYNKPSQQGLIAHFSAIAEKVDLPSIIYNVPPRTNVNMLPDTVLKLDREFDHIVGLKEAVGTDTEAGQKQALTVLEGRSPGFAVWSGNDSDTFFFLENGGDGVVSVASHICGSLISEMIEAHAMGDRTRSEELNNRMMPYFKALFPPQPYEPSPSSIKASLNANGIAVGGLRLPLLEQPEEYKNRLQAVLTDCGLTPHMGAK